MGYGTLQEYGGGGNNPCGAYYPDGGPLSNFLIVDGCYNGPVSVNHNTLSTANNDNFIFTTRGKGICCDLFDRVGAEGYSWGFNTSYSMFDTVAATGDKCPGCFYHNYNPYNTGNPYNISDIDWGSKRPCETTGPLADAGFGITSYVEHWSSCKLLLDRGLPGPCTMHNSFGLIFEDTVNISHAGSPNGSCTENCMQLTANYFEQRVAGQNLDYAQYPPNNYNPETAYDSEVTTQDFQGNTGPTGPKLIWAGFAPNQWQPADSEPEYTDLFQAGFVTVTEIQGPINTNPVPGINTSTPIFWDPTGGNNPATYQYPFIDVIDNITYQGYLPQGASVDNSWGLLSPALGGTPPQPESKLWARKSVWRIQPPGEEGPTTSTNDAFANCTYVSFGCTDPTFGNYNPYAELDCAGYPKTNVWIPDVNGNPTPCLNINGGVVDYCWDPATGLQCNNCIDPNTGDYNITLPTCTPEIYNACGGDGYLTAAAWGAMILSRPESWLYGGGAASLGLIGFGDGFARFWDKDGNDRTQIQEFIDNNLNPNALDRPLCQCNNSGCMLPTASNYSPLNTTDCSNEPAGGGVGFFGQYGDVTCCVFEKFGCPDNTYVTPPQNNYFCSVDLNGDGTPDNLEFCMDPATGIPCVNPISGIVNQACLQGSVPGANAIPLSNDGGNYNNPTVNLTDDGSCELILIPGCKDDGGPLAGGNFPASLYPGYSAINFDPTATVHVQILCEYVFGCPDPLAQNVINGLPVCQSNTLTGTISQAATYYGVTNTDITNNLIPNIECCDYNIPGTGPGCTDPNALNYNPLADTDDGSCIYSIEGCTDPNALNFNPSATLDDSSCLYPGDYPSEGDNFLDGTPIEICREPLTKEEVLMNVCQPTEIQSEVFIERGKQSVFEPNQRLDEVKTIGGLKIYGYGFYNIKEQI